MAKTDWKSVDAYIGSQPEASRAVLERVRGIIRKALPDAEEVISYQIPAYRFPSGLVLFFAGWKDHYSLYPATEQLIEAFEDDLAPYEISKGTIRFPLSRPVPVKLIERIAKFRAKETTERVKAKVPAKAKKAATKKSPARILLPSGATDEGDKQGGSKRSPARRLKASR
jgi:uncharacterized protein YdhG (YjbR/CyaY superfamily)